MKASSLGHRVPTTLVLSLGAVGAFLIAILGSDDSFAPLSVAAGLVGLVPWALVAGGVRVPLWAFASVSVVCCGLIVVVDGNEGGMFPMMLTVVWIARSSGSWWLNGAVLAASIGLIVAAAVRQGSAHETGLVYFAGGVGISWLTGQMLRRQEALTVELQAMNELRVEHAAAAERARIAREVHDVVAHSLTVVMLHLTGARRAVHQDPARADEALARAETVGRESLDSIREVMGLLREPGSGVDVPLPGLADVPAMIDSYRSGGMVVVDAVEDVAPLDHTAGLVVYRIVQESLTNAQRHAPGTACSITIRSPGERSVEVEIRNGPGGPGSPSGRNGHGLRGMTERVRALGGDVQSGRTPDGGWRVRATIPRRGRVEPSEAIDPEVSWPQPTVR